MFGLTNASKGIQDAATISDVNNAKQQAYDYTDAKIAALYRGYPVVTATGTSVTPAWNTEVRMTGVNVASINIPGTPATTDAQTHEIRLIVKFADTGSFGLTFNVATGQSLLWPDDEPEWATKAAGKLYEISISPILTDGATTYVVAYAKEIELS